MDEQALAAIDAAHQRVMVCGRAWNHWCVEPPERAECAADHQDWPCETARLVAEVRRLRAGLQAALDEGEADLNCCNGAHTTVERVWDLL